jgi:hypothetical protein
MRTMTLALAKFTVDLLMPGALLTPGLTKWYAKWPAFHSRRTIWPAKPMTDLLDIREDGSTVKEEFFHIRVTSMSDEYDGVSDGALDRLLANYSFGTAFQDELPRITSVALELASPYVGGKSFAAWIDLYEVQLSEEGDDGTIQFIRRISVEDIAKEAPTR